MLSSTNFTWSILEYFIPNVRGNNPTQTIFNLIKTAEVKFKTTTPPLTSILCGKLDSAFLIQHQMIIGHKFIYVLMAKVTSKHWTSIVWLLGRRTSISIFLLAYFE